MMDLSKTASALLDMLYEKPKPDHEAQRAIEAALKEAYNAGLADKAMSTNNDGYVCCGTCGEPLVCYCKNCSEI